MKQLMRWAFTVALGTTIVGAGVHQISEKSSLGKINSPISSATSVGVNTSSVSFDPLIGLPEAQRLSKWTALAETSSASQERSRARYLLANMHLNQRDPKAALALLTPDLATEYPILAEYILLKRAQAQSQIQTQSQAPESDIDAKITWNQILQKYPNSPVAAEALYALGRYDEMLKQFPAHPRSLVVIRAGLRQSPNRADLMTLMAVYFNDQKDIVPILNRLVNGYGSGLKPDQWWAIADAYWDNREFSKASLAYGRASQNAVTAYRLGRSLQKSRKNAEAYIAFSRMAQQYPDSPQAPRALIRMVETAANPNDALKAVDRIVVGYPDTAAEALLQKYELLRAKNNAKAASDTANLLLSQYGSSNAAVELSWKLARQRSQTGDLKGAIAIAQKVVTSNATGETAAEIAYWAGKWSQRLGDSTQAKKAFELVMTKYPDSYYAWRSAQQLGWQVGDFTSLRSINLPIQPPSDRYSLPAGSPALQELYLLGQNRDACDRWQFETRGRQLKTAKEIFTDGVMRVGVNDNLIGINQLESLSWIDVTASEKADIERLRRQPTYWQTLYPFPYWNTVLNRAEKNRLNPALVMGLIRQESRFESQILSRSGAVGLMQVMPDTGTWIAQQRGVKSFSLKNPDHNVDFGTWYLDYTHRRYNNNSMLAVASYNAGPGRVGEWVAKGLGDPDEFVERIPYDETRGYVRHVLGNYWNYLRLYSPQIKQQLAQLESQKVVGSARSN